MSENAPLSPDLLFDPFEGGDVDPKALPKSRGHSGYRRKPVRSLFEQAMAIAGDPSLDPDKNADAPGAISKKQPDHNVRTREHFEKLGFVYARAEWWVSDYQGTQRKKDLYGLFDGLALKGSQVFGVQIGGAGRTTEKIRDLCSDKVKDGYQGTTNAERLRRWLRAGGRVLVVCWDKPGRLWESTTTEVTEAHIEQVASRRRKKVS